MFCLFRVIRTIVEMINGRDGCRTSLIVLLVLGVGGTVEIGGKCYMTPRM